ncbi:MAG: hypothetical protein A3I61_08395 [Acidobacteria bacterium RIFCSPLOWO2_02_FULL_68_18]|nr:MAG: hypothetical protein A3I61_08395 [Acidobacteria bacterium RIFCSPLOWO2_02_FULL_68_18]OFW48870.1 MAG: hypothetical protein A3G77_01515 [Acidobacteria bacterium RIFCSPLOWO2_12_FULL_68_19]
MTDLQTTIRSAEGPTRRPGRSFLAALAAVLWLGGCDNASAPDVSGTAAPPPETAAVPPDNTLTLTEEAMSAGGIRVEAARAEGRAGYFETPAVLRVDETRTARIGSIVEGIVSEVAVQVGSRVPKGALLASIHSHLVHEAWAGYRRALAERRRATTELAFATDAEGRALRLLATKAVSQQEAERARTDRAAAEQTLVIAESEVLRALDELDHLGIMTEDIDLNNPRETIPITAPLGGVVLDRLVTEGTGITPGTLLFVISDLSRLWAVAEIDETRLPALAVGRTVELTVPAYPQRTFSARIVAIGDVVDPDTRRVTARIEVDNRDGALKPQMYAAVRVQTTDEADIVLVPASAVQKLDQQTVVFVEQQPGRFSRRAIVPGSEREGFVEVVDGLQANERVATAGTFLIKSKFLERGQAE